jgi:4-hydroxybenzoate polyprenyltransferase
MVHQASLLFGVSFPFPFYLFVFAGSVCSYNFHWFLTPPQVPAVSPKLRWNLSNKNLHLTLSIVGFISAGIGAFLLIEHWLWLAFSGLFTFLYTAPMINRAPFMHLRKIAVGKTIYLAFAWMHITALLPLLIELPAIETRHVLYAINRFFYLYAICIVFDRRDREADRKAGVRSLITWLDEKGIDRLFWVLLVIVLITTIFLSKSLGTAQAVALLIPAIILSLLYERSRQSRSDYLYYFLLDGLMALSAPILILLSFAR